jgi:RNA-directed DNA polymerase
VSQLRLTHPAQVAQLLDTQLPHLCNVLRRADEYYDEFELQDPRNPSKVRHVVGANGVLRAWQSRFYKQSLLPNLKRSPHSHGGVPGRSTLTNVNAHQGQRFVFTVDVAAFYPSIHRERVVGLFKRLGCTEDVARICARLCTYRHRLEQGLVTSPILADLLMRPVDDRIAAACRKIADRRGTRTLTYTRFVDDLAISSPFDLASSGIPGLVNRILKEHGFRRNASKDQFGAVSENASITRLRFPNGHPDVERTYIVELDRQLADHARLGRDEPFDGPYYTQQQIRGRVLYVCRINPGRRRQLLAMLRTVDWAAARTEAYLRGLVVARKRVVPASKYRDSIGP